MCGGIKDVLWMFYEQGEARARGDTSPLPIDSCLMGRVGTGNNNRGAEQGLLKCSSQEGGRGPGQSLLDKNCAVLVKPQSPALFCGIERIRR